MSISGWLKSSEQRISRGDTSKETVGGGPDRRGNTTVLRWNVYVSVTCFTAEEFPFLTDEVGTWGS